jgi:hypothetical protein
MHKRAIQPCVRIADPGTFTGFYVHNVNLYGVFIDFQIIAIFPSHAVFVSFKMRVRAVRLIGCSDQSRRNGTLPSARKRKRESKRESKGSRKELHDVEHD